MYLSLDFQRNSLNFYMKIKVNHLKIQTWLFGNLYLWLALKYEMTTIQKTVMDVKDLSFHYLRESNIIVHFM